MVFLGALRLIIKMRSNIFLSLYIKSNIWMDLHMCTRKVIEKKQYGEEAEKQFLYNFPKKIYEGLQYQKIYRPSSDYSWKRMSILLLSEPIDLKRSFRICLLLRFFVSTLVDYQSANHDLASTFCLHTKRTCGSTW